VLDAGGGRFVYCSTLASYVHNLTSHRLEKLIASHEVTASRCWSLLTLSAENNHRLDLVPRQPQFLRNLRNRQVQTNLRCCCSMLCRRILKWDVNEEKEVAVMNLSDPPVMIDWCQHDSATIAVLLRPGSVYLWDTLNFNSGIEPVRALQTGACDLNFPSTSLLLAGAEKASCFRWNCGNQGSPKLAVGHLDGL